MSTSFWYRVVDKLWLIQMILNFCVGNLAKCVRLMSFEFGRVHAPLLMAFFGYSTRVCTGELVGFDPGAICRTLDWELRYSFAGFMCVFSGHCIGTFGFCTWLWLYIGLNTHTSLHYNSSEQQLLNHVSIRHPIPRDWNVQVA